MFDLLWPSYLQRNLEVFSRLVWPPTHHPSYDPRQHQATVKRRQLLDYFILYWKTMNIRSYDERWTCVMMFVHLAKVIKPAGMNFQELRNLSPITTVRVPEVPAGTRSCVLVKAALGLSQLNKTNLLTEREPDILGILRCQISTDCSKQAEQEPRSQRGDAACGANTPAFTLKWSVFNLMGCFFT